MCSVYLSRELYCNLCTCMDNYMWRSVQCVHAQQGTCIPWVYGTEDRKIQTKRKMTVSGHVGNLSSDMLILSLQEGEKIVSTHPRGFFDAAWSWFTHELSTCECI